VERRAANVYSLAMSEELAIELFVADGGIAREWHAIDEVARLHYRKLATQTNSCVVTASARKSAPRRQPRQPLVEQETAPPLQEG
jgi:hypothetical protein